MMMPTDDHMSKSARRIEVFTGAGRRREWSAEQKAAILAESYAWTSSVCDVARAVWTSCQRIWSDLAMPPIVEGLPDDPKTLKAMLIAERIRSGLRGP